MHHAESLQKPGMGDAETSLLVYQLWILEEEVTDSFFEVAALRLGVQDSGEALELKHYRLNSGPDPYAIMRRVRRETVTLKEFLPAGEGMF